MGSNNLLGRMKRIFAYTILMFAGFVMQGQQMSQYTHFIKNYISLNPAAVGSVKCIELNLGHRLQWVGVNGAPVTSFANFQGKIGQNKFNFHGIGAVIETDDTGPLSYTTLSLAYAYHMRTSRKGMLSMGLSVGFAQYRVDYAEMTFVDYSDPAIIGSVSDIMIPQINAGIWYYKSDRFIGFSVRNITRNEIDIAFNEFQGDPGISNLWNHFEITGGKHIKLSEDFTFKPSAQLKYVKGSKLALDVNGMMDFRNKFALGVGARSGNGISGLMTVDLFKYVSLSYAYDLTLSKMRLDGMNSHEIILGIRACAKGGSRSKIQCAAYN